MIDGTIDTKCNKGIVIQECTIIYIMASMKRYLEIKIYDILEKRKIILMYGIKQAEKTALVKRFFDGKSSLYLNGDSLGESQSIG